MQGWQTPYLGQREIPREHSQFELQAFFSFSALEHELGRDSRSPLPDAGVPQLTTTDQQQERLMDYQAAAAKFGTVDHEGVALGVCRAFTPTAK